MKRLLFAIVAILILFLAGWLTYSGSDDRASINVETEEIREDTEEMLEGTEELLREAGEETEDLLREADERIDNESVDDAETLPSDRATDAGPVDPAGDGVEEP